MESGAHFIFSLLRSFTCTKKIIFIILSNYNELIFRGLVLFKCGI